MREKTVIEEEDSIENVIMLCGKPQERSKRTGWS
jgi:hypothetical protein